LTTINSLPWSSITLTGDLLALAGGEELERLLAVALPRSHGL
jgi:hypothetical protein